MLNTVNHIFSRPFFGSLCGLMSSLLIAFPAVAGMDDDDLLLLLSGDEQLISIATGTPVAISRSPAVASVITAEDIHASGAKTVVEALEQVPGLHIGVSPKHRSTPVFSFRGIHTSNSPQALILFNGHEIPDTFNSSIISNLYMPVENIARIEVIRGPGSAVYGADAFSGVINIITKTAAEIDGFRSGVKLGSFETRNIWGQYGGEHQGWRVAASVEYGGSEGDRGRVIERDFQTLLDARMGTSASKAGGAMDTRFKSLVSSISVSKNKWQLQLNSWNQRDTGVGSGAANALDPTGRTELDQYLMSVKYTNNDWQPDWSLMVDVSYVYADLNINYSIFPAGTRLPIGTDGNLNFSSPAGVVDFPDGYLGNPAGTAQQSRIDIASIYTGMNAHQWRLNVGVKYTEERDRESKNFGPGVIDGTVSPIDGTLTDVTGTPFVFSPGASRMVRYISVQDQWFFANDWTFTAGARFDNYSDVGSTINPRLSLVWNTRHDLTSKILYGRAFRAPAFGELYAVNNPVVLGNKNLDPETIDTVELAFDYKPVPAINLLLNIFHYRIDGLIDYVDEDGIPGGASRAQNSMDQVADGFEFEAKWQVSRSVRLFGNTAFQNARDASSGEIMADAPRKQIQLGGSWRIGQRWFSRLDAFRIMDRPRPASDPRAQIADYTWVNFTLYGQIPLWALDTQFAVRNLFDVDAREPAPITVPNDYPLEGRSYSFAISKEF